MKKYSVLIIIVILIVSSFCWFFWLNKEKTAYVDIKKLYEDFTMKKELSDQLSMVQNGRNKILDSLEMELKILSQRISTKKTESDMAIFNVKRDNFFSKKDQFTQDNQATIADYDSKILKQLNQYIEDYGKENNYVYILGYSGNGELLYAKKTKDITTDLVTYVNNRYKGLK